MSDHVFGFHDKCCNILCDTSLEKNENGRQDLIDSGSWLKLLATVRALANNRNSLIRKVNSNIVERSLLGVKELISLLGNHM